MGICEHCTYFNRFYTLGGYDYLKSPYGMCNKCRKVMPRSKNCEYWKERKQLSEKDIYNWTINRLEYVCDRIMLTKLLLEEHYKPSD